MNYSPHMPEETGDSEYMPSSSGTDQSSSGHNPETERTHEDCLEGRVLEGQTLTGRILMGRVLTGRVLEGRTLNGKNSEDEKS